MAALHDMTMDRNPTDSQEGGGIDNPAFVPSGAEMAQKSLQEQPRLDEMQTEPLSSKDDVMANEVDNLQQKLGGYGRYQILIYALLGLVYMRGSWQALVPIFQGLVPNYHCNPSPGLTLNQSVPPGDASQCKQYVNYSISNKTEDCKNGWNMSWDEEGLTSIVSEYTLLCDDAYLSDLSTTLYMVGTTCGVIFLSPLSERFGAKTVMLACLWLQVVVGVALPWAGSITVFIVFKFFIGLFNMTIALCVAVLMSETFDGAHRELPVLGIQFFWAGGIMSLSLLGYLLPNWKYLQLVISIPINVMSVAYIWLIPQSLPWLLSKGKVNKAERVVKRYLKVNSLSAIPNLRDILQRFGSSSGIAADKGDAQINNKDVLFQTAAEDSSDRPTFTVLDLFKDRTLAMYTCILCYLFLANALSYFGIIFNTPNLDGNRYLNLFLLGLVEIPAYICCIVANKFIGRRLSIFGFMLICAIANTPVTFIPDVADSGADLTKLKTALVMIGKFGITGSYSAIYLYASEVLPTVVRNQGVGFCSFFENIGSIAAPNMVYVSLKWQNLPLTIFGAMTVVGAIAILFLPETHNRPLPQTLEDAKSRGRKKGLFVVNNSETM